MTSKKSSFNTKYVFLIVICLAYFVASLIDAEKTGGMEASGKLLFSHLEANNISYDEFVIKLYREEL